jgi:hypothetical protein
MATHRIIPDSDADDFGPNASGAHAKRLHPAAFGTTGQMRMSAAQARTVWAEVYARQDLTAEERKPRRLLIAWRMTREIAVRRGLLGADAPLSDLKTEWCRVFTGNTDDLTAGLPEEKWTLNGLLARGDGIPLHPGNPPEPTPRFERAAALLAEELQLEEGCSADPMLGYYGLQGLLHLWPTQEEILRLEEELIDATQRQIESMGQARVADYLVSITGMSRTQALRFSRVAMWRMRAETAVDPQLATAVHILQLEKLIHRAQIDGNSAVELRAHRELILLRGLTKHTSDATLDEMQEYIERLDAEDDSDTPEKTDEQ